MHNQAPITAHDCFNSSIVVQFEDPAPGLQQLREKLEVEMMNACDWITAPADAALAAAAAEERKLQEAAKRLWAAGGKQEQQQQPQQAAAAANGAGSSGAGSSEGVSTAEGAKSPASFLTIPVALQQRITKELKIHKHQVR